jgi:hypothetical protein
LDFKTQVNIKNKAGYLGKLSDLTESHSMSLNPLTDTAIACAENVALLHLLHSVPTTPSSNPTDSLRDCRRGYTLSLERERNLADTLAFLSNIEDDPNHIPAVCVEEGPKSAFLNVLVAVNKAKRNDGHQFLRKLKLGFERIFVVLSRAQDRECCVIFLLFIADRCRKEAARQTLSMTSLLQ